MTALEYYIDQKNRFRRIFDKPEISFPPTAEEVSNLCDALGGDLSPENLHCDGEISAAEARSKYDFYMEVQAELSLLPGYTDPIY